MLSIRRGLQRLLLAAVLASSITLLPRFAEAAPAVDLPRIRTRIQVVWSPRSGRDATFLLELIWRLEPRPRGRGRPGQAARRAPPWEWLPPDLPPFVDPEPLVDPLEIP